MIKVVHLIPTLDQSGAEKQLALLACRLPPDEFDIRVIALTRGGPYEHPLRERGIPVTVLNKRWKLDPATLWKLRKQLLADRPDIVHTWLFAANAYGRLLIDGSGSSAFGGQPAPRIIVSERCVDTWKSGWQLWLDRRLIPRTARLIANSQSVADFYQSRGVPEDRLAVIPNGIECPPPQAENRNAALQELDIPPGAKVVGYVGRLAKQKRVGDLVWAMQLLRQLTEPVYFLIVGDGPERKSLLRFAQHLGCDHLIRMTGHRADAPRLISLMDLFWLASDFEGMSNSVMEAMAAGKPVIASDIPPNRELVVDGETGFLVRVGDGVGFAQFADRLLNDSEMAARFGDAGRQRMQNEFGVDRMVSRHIDLYRTVLASRSEVPVEQA